MTGNLSKKADQELAEALLFFKGETFGSADEPPPERGEAAAKEILADWEPDLNPTQRRIFDDPSLYVLGYGEKGSGKSIAFGHKIIRHAYENDNALVMIITPTIRTGNEGIWHDLDTLIIPQWVDGIGLEATQSKLDPLTKDRHRWIKNMHGGWSKLMLLSIPYATQVEDRIKGPAPSMVYIDELTNCDGKEYYTYPSAQLGRRRGIKGPQQFLASCNPKGPSNWVYQVFWVDHLNEETGVRDKDYAVYHVPISENEHRLPDGYVDRLMKLFKGDKTEIDRLIHGIWIDKPLGDGLFKENFNVAIHVKGDAKKCIGLRPVKGFPIRIGYDLGQVNQAIVFMQKIPTKDKSIWLAFDEIIHIDKRVIYRRLALDVVEKMRYWKRAMDYQFSYMHITDESAVNQYRPGDGSYDAWHFEKEFNAVAAEFGGKKMKMVGCPKGAGSVAARVLLLNTKLAHDEFYISATCKHVHDMLMFLEPDPKEPEKPKRSKFLHPFDAVTYPIFKSEISGDSRTSFTDEESGAVGLIRIGSN